MDILRMQISSTYEFVQQQQKHSLKRSFLNTPKICLKRLKNRGKVLKVYFAFLN